MKSTTDSKFYKDIRRRARYCYKNIPSDNFIIMTGVTWSGDFEPNSMSKANHGSVWIKTLTFFSKTYLSNSLEGAYPISISLKNNNYDDIERIFIEELEELTSNKGIFYSEAWNKNAYVYFE